MTIKAIIWDNWGVIVDAKCGSIAKVWSDLLNAPIEGIAKVFSGDEINQCQAAEITTEEYYDYVIRELNLPEESKDLLRNEPMESYSYDEDLVSYIRKLKKDYTIALLTNVDHSFLKKCRDYYPEVVGMFDPVIASCVVKMIKPDPNIYKLTLKNIGCKPEEAVFIDDTEVFVKAAIDLGIHGIQYSNREQAIHDLETLLAAKR